MSRGRLFPLCLILLGYFSVAWSCSQFYVSVDEGNNADLSCGLTPNAGACASIQVAIEVALADPNPCSIITVASGTYKGLNNTNLEFGGRRALGKNITLQAASSSFDDSPPLILVEPMLYPKARAFVMQSDVGTVEGFVVEMAPTSNVSRLNTEGGAVLLSASALLFRRCLFRYFALDPIRGFESAGGAMATTKDQVSHSVLRIEQCEFWNNSAVAAGALYFTGTTTVSIHDSLFMGNRAQDIGGAMVPEGSAVGLIVNTTFAFNYAPYGGAVDDGGRASTQYRDCHFVGNSAIYGGAYYSFGESAVEFDRCRFANNTATNSGGAVYTASTSPVPIRACHFHHNYALSGGVIRVNAGKLTLSDALFEDNSADEYGLFNVNSAMHAINITAYRTRAKRCWAGVVSVAGWLVVEHGRFLDNTAVEEGFILESAGIHHFEQCLFQANRVSRTSAVMTLQGTANATFHACTFKDNSAREGGVGSLLEQAHPTFTNCSFIGNSAVRAGGVMTTDAGTNLSCYDCVFRHNMVRSSGGVLNGNGDLDFNNVIFQGNSAKFGGVMYFPSLASAWSDLLGMVHNPFGGGGGGGVGSDSVCAQRPKWQHVQFVENQASQMGGVMAWEDAAPECDLGDYCADGSAGCVYVDNTAPYGSNFGFERLASLSLTNQSTSIARCSCLEESDDVTEAVSTGFSTASLSIQPGALFSMSFFTLDHLNHTISAASSFMQLQVTVIPSNANVSYRIQGQQLTDVYEGLGSFSSLSLVGEPGEYTIQVSQVTYSPEDVPVSFDVHTTLRPCDNDHFVVVRDPFYRCLFVRRVNTNSVAMLVVTMTLMTVFVLLSLFMHYFIWRHRNHPYIKAATVPFCHLITLGSFFGYACMSMLGLDFNSQFRCALPVILLCVWWALTFGSLVLKNARIYAVFMNERLSLKVITNNALLKRVVVLLAYDLVIIACWYGIDPIKPRLVPDSNDPMSDNWQCHSDNLWLYLGLLIAPKGAMLLYGCFIAFKVRNVADRFNESKYIGYSINNITFMGILSIPMWSLLRDYATAVYVVLLVTSISAFLGTMLINFLPKMWSVYVSTTEGINTNSIHTQASTHSDHSQQMSSFKTVITNP